MKKVILGSVVVLILATVFMRGMQAQALSAGMSACEVKVHGEKLPARCGSVTVPENRADADSRLITLPVTQILATSDVVAEPIFYLAGGPGMTNMKFQPPLGLLQNHDVVLVGYRGVDGSVKLDCDEVKTAVTGTGNDLFSAASQDNLSKAIAACSQRLTSEGVDLAGYTIPEVVADMEAAREMLGYGRINLLSESYGTRVAQIYAQIASESISRSVMIGVNTPGHFVWEPEVIDGQLAQYAALCAADADCQARTDDLVATMREVNGNMPASWMGMSINPGKVKAVTFALLFHPNTAVFVIDAYLSASEGDASGLAMLSQAYDLLIPNMSVWGEFFAKGYSSDYDASRDYNDLADPDSVMGSPMAQLLWPVADGWNGAVIDETYRQVQPSSVETLLIGGDIDFSTPVQFATEELLPSLENGQQVILKNMGHTNDVWNAQPEATEHLLVTYFATGAADDSGYVDQAISFAPGVTLSIIAKGLPGLGILLMLLVGLVLYKLIKSRRSKSGL